MLTKNYIQEKKTVVNTSCECGCGCACNPTSAEKKGFKSVFKASMRSSFKESELLSKS